MAAQRSGFGVALVLAATLALVAGTVMLRRVAGGMGVTAGAVDAGTAASSL